MLHGFFFIILNTLAWLILAPMLGLLKLLGFMIGLDLSKLKSKEKWWSSTGGCLLQSAYAKVKLCVHNKY